MHNVGIVKTAHDMGNHRRLADIGKELVAKPIPLACTLDKPRYIYKIHACRNLPFGLEYTRHKVQAFIRQVNHAHIGVDGTEWIILRRSRSLGKRAENS